MQDTSPTQDGTTANMLPIYQHEAWRRGHNSSSPVARNACYTYAYTGLFTAQFLAQRSIGSGKTTKSELKKKKSKTSAVSFFSLDFVGSSHFSSHFLGASFILIVMPTISRMIEPRTRTAVGRLQPQLCPDTSWSFDRESARCMISSV